MKVQRILNLPSLLQKKSFFLLGPRGTGKTFLVREQLGAEAIAIDLLHSDYYLRLSAAPHLLEAIVEAGQPKAYVVIDEIQKIPQLLDEVHRLIEGRRWKFLLTGSSARKLRRGSANLLAGRAWTAELFPLSWREMPHFDLERLLRYGGLPAVYLGEDPEEELQAYARTYLYEEIQAEGSVRKLPPFSRFLRTAALSNGQILNFTTIGSDAQVSPSTVREYYQILEDTLVGFMLPAWTESKSRKAASTGKFYFFDTGVVNTLAGTRTVERNSDLYGRCFEHWLAMEIRAALSYRRSAATFRFWRSRQGNEVDFLLGSDCAIEAKATTQVQRRHAAGLYAIKDENVFRRYYLVSQDTIEQTSDGIRFVHWRTFLEKLWSDAL